MPASLRGQGVRAAFQRPHYYFDVVTSILQSLMAATFLVDRILARRRQTEEENRSHCISRRSTWPSHHCQQERQTKWQNSSSGREAVELIPSKSPLRYQVISTKVKSMSE